MNHLLRVRLLRALALSVGALAALVLPTAAQADIPITSFKAGPVPAFNNVSGLPVNVGVPTDPAVTDLNCIPANPAAPTLAEGVVGKNTDYCIVFRATPGDAIAGEDINNTLVQLPVGTQGDIDLAAKCTVEAFGREVTTRNTCPPESQIGTTISQLQVPDSSAGKNPAVDRTVSNAPGRIYALSTPSDKAALLGIALVGTGGTESKYTITVSQLGDPKVGLQNQTDALAKVIGPAPIAIQATSLRFWGNAADHPHWASPFAPSATTVTPAANFMRVGSTCQTDQTATLTINPYTDTVATAGSKPTTQTSTYKLTGCDSLPFAPTFSASLSGETNPGGHPQLDIRITSPAGNEDLGATKITLPVGIATDLDRLQNACPQATFQAGGCPDAATIGSVKATLSGIGADVLSGNVVKVKIDGKQLPGIGLNFKGRLPLRVFGVSDVDSSGRLVSTFSDLPSLPQRTLDITLAGGSTGILQTDPSGKCTASAYDATITGQNGKVKTISQSTSCSDQFTATLSNQTSTHPVLLIGSSVATGKKIKSLRIGLPKGLKFDGPTLRKSKKVTYAASGFDAGFDTSKTKVAKVGSKAKWTFTGAGSNGFSVLTHTGVLDASKAFAKSTKTVYVEFRAVYNDGTKVSKYVALKRAG